ncbi:MAG: hypothetical protein NW226_12300 [Microscillaceae bacterium]|nr:hypothetical protein [Microscillaceae bacterium]
MNFLKTILILLSSSFITGCALYGVRVKEPNHMQLKVYPQKLRKLNTQLKKRKIVIISYGENLQESDIANISLTDSTLSFEFLNTDDNVDNLKMIESLVFKDEDHNKDKEHWVKVHNRKNIKPAAKIYIKGVFTPSNGINTIPLSQISKLEIYGYDNLESIIITSWAGSILGVILLYLIF